MSERVSAQAGLAELSRRVSAGERVRVHGAGGAFAAVVLAHLAERGDERRRPIVALVADDDRAEQLERDLAFFMPTTDDGEPLAASRILRLPADDTSPYAEVSPDRRIVLQRMATLFRLSQGSRGEVLIASADALRRRVVPRAAFASLVDVIEAEQDIDRDRCIELLAKGGYLRTPVVEDPGTFAVRGGVIDVYPPIYKFPVRIELFGDMVERIRLFDPASQRTLREIKEVYLHPVREVVLTDGNKLRERLRDAGDHASIPSSFVRGVLEQVDRGEDFFGKEALAPAFHASLETIFSYLPADAPIYIEEPESCLDAIAELHDADAAAYASRVEANKLVLPPADFYLDRAEVQAALDAGGRAFVESRSLEIVEAGGVKAATIGFELTQLSGLRVELARSRVEKHEELLRPLVDRLEELADQGTRVWLVAPNLQHADRLRSLLAGYGIRAEIGSAPGWQTLLEGGPPTLQITVGGLTQGFHLPMDAAALVAESEIFGDKAARRAPKRGRGFDRDAFKNLEPGGFVVHKTHGVGIYKGLTKLPLKAARAGEDAVAVDFLHLEYEGGALYLPVWRLSEVQAFAGADGVTPKVDRLGGLTWEKTRGKVSREIRQMAEELIQLYAQRQALPGHAYHLVPDQQALFSEFEATFPFEETPDQQKAIDEVLNDLEAPRPMDRLVCGDVGYGKTEVAIRAATKVVLGGKQVALLAPTTVLVEQHANTFKARLRDLPVRVESLSRYKSAKEQAEVVKALADGKVDVVVGTHRVLSADVRFKELGLVVIDEEQRFGVTHKERLKKLRTQVDVLTLTATPIPRTLHMALLGLREISIITTPPVDRLAVRTLVGKYNDALITEGVKREMARGGQIFFVHNRVEDIYEWSERLHELLPEVRIVVGHGQMPSEELEKVMVKFVSGQADMLLCTTIIESGLDISRANTMFVNRADRFGLAQLYQLRGRIGRSKERAYCYLLIPPEDSLNTEAKQRLAVLQRFTELGAGFQVASHDLEIRGAGDLLGAKQSGMIAAVGFETYTQILAEAVAELRGEPIASERDPEITTDVPAFIPEQYCPDVGQRLDFYRRFSQGRSDDEIADTITELTDRYGDPPEEVQLLAQLMQVKALARRLRATALELSETRISIALADDTPLDPRQVMKLVSQKGSLWKLTPDMRLQRAFQGNERERRLESARQLLATLVEGLPSA
jgi:transcription-repair coupling factor (superfamily II helicase)